MCIYRENNISILLEGTYYITYDALGSSAMLYLDEPINSVSDKTWPDVASAGSVKHIYMIMYRIVPAKGGRIIEDAGLLNTGSSRSDCTRIGCIQVKDILFVANWYYGIM